MVWQPCCAIEPGCKLSGICLIYAIATSSILCKHRRAVMLASESCTLQNRNKNILFDGRASRFEEEVKSFPANDRRRTTHLDRRTWFLFPS